MSSPEHHTDEHHDSGAGLAVALVGLFLIAGFFLTPWFFDDTWSMGYRSAPVVFVPKPAPPVVAGKAPQQDYSDPGPPPAYSDDFVPQGQPVTPDLSQLSGKAS
tara:strand:+ start:659 stop:970 length:312 start_codon:yes stop_codon:yes gene_type:complete